MKYVYGKKIKTLRDRLTTGLAALALLANTAGMSLPFVLTQRVAAASNSVTTTDLSTWYLGDSKSGGHSEIVTNGLRVWTTGGSSDGSNRKAAGYYAVTPFALASASDADITFASFTDPRPSLQLGVDIDGDGDWDGYLVYEPWAYGAGNWWTSKDFGLPSGAGYEDFGTISDFAAANSNAKVISIGYSLGTLGSHPDGDSVISKITVNDTDYTFSLPPYVPTVPPTKPTIAGDVIYDSIPNTLPSNSLSVGYQATQTRELGDKITFAGTSRDLKHAAVTLSSWACETGGGTTCVTTPGATFSHPITLNLYEVAGDGSVGTIIDSVTQTFAIPYRPSADPTCAGGTAWRDTNGNCFNGLNHVIVFDASGITVPDSIIYSVAYNTQSYGSPALGAAGPYNSLNVSLNAAVPTVGTNQNADEAYWSSTYGGRTLGLAADSGWTSDGNPAVLFTAQAPNAAPVVTFAAPTPIENAYVRGTITPHVLATDDYGMGSYYIRLWKNSFESGSTNLAVNNCWSAPGAFLLGAAQDVTCPSIDTTTLTDGKYVLSAQFQDGHIVWGQNLRTFNIDNTAPKFTIKPESIGNTTTKVYSSVSFKLEDPGNGQIDYVTINGIKKELTNSKWSDVNGVKPGVFGAVEGENTLVIYDVAGNATTYIFYLDTTGPTVTVKSATSGYTPYSDEAASVGGYPTFTKVNFKLFDSNKVVGYTINGVWKPLTPNNWSDANFISIGQMGGVSGLNTIIARDDAGNETSFDFYLVADTPAPTVLGITYNEQPDGTELNSGDTTYLKDFTFTLTGSPTTVHYQLKYWNDIVGSPFKEASPWAPGNDSWDDHMTTLGTYTDLFTQGYGTHYFSFSACDADNNCSEFSEPFVVTYAKDDGSVAGCSTDEICCDAVNALDAEGCDEDNDDEDEESEGETGGVVNGAFTDTPSNGLGGQVLGATDGLTNTGTQNSGLFVLLAMGLVGIAFVTMRRKQEN